MKPSVEIYLSTGNWLEIYLDPEFSRDEDIKMKLGIALNRTPVVKYSVPKRAYIVSLYYYDKVIKVLEGAGFKVTVEERIPKYFKRLDRRVNSRHVELPSSAPSAWIEDKPVLNYQLDAVRCVLRRNKFIFAEEMGLGKTVEALCSMCYGFDMGYKRALIVVMASLKEQWRHEIKKFTKFTDDDIIILGDTKNMKCKTGKVEKYNGNTKICRECRHYENCKLMKNSPDKARRNQLLKQKKTKIVIVNYELLHKYMEQIKNGGFDIYIVDEVSKLKNYAAKSTKAMMKIARSFEYDDMFIPMSGTLVENRIQEFYPVFNMMDEAIFGTWTNFKNRYLVTDFFGKPIDVKNLKELKEIVSKFIIRRTTDEVWKDRPELFEVYRFCEMSPLQRRFYNEIAAGEVEQLRGGLVKKINRMQVASLLVYLIMVADTLESVKELQDHTADEYSCKLKMLKDMLNEEITGKVVLFSRFAHRVIPIIVRELDREKIGNLSITGGTKTSERSNIIEKFSKDENCRVLVCSDAMGYGANIQCADYVINFDLPWNPAVLDQRIARVYRIGQTKKVTVINMITKDTAEDLVLDKIYSKRQMFKQVLKEGIRPKSLLNNISIEDIARAIG